jgi:hypothetical protein
VEKASSTPHSSREGIPGRSATVPRASARRCDDAINEEPASPVPSLRVEQVGERSTNGKSGQERPRPLRRNRLLGRPHLQVRPNSHAALLPLEIEHHPLR